MEIIDDYAIGTIIGKGSYAAVKEALDIRTQDRVAVKVIAKSTLKSIENGELLVKREVSILSTLRHPNVIRMLDDFIVTEKEKMYIVLEFADGGNLQQLLDKAPSKKLGMYQSQKIYKGLVKGMIYLHKEKVVHRDLKPENILLMVDGTVKIGDFGCAVRVGSDHEIEGSLFGPGSPAFQPPEAETVNGLSYKLDVWSSGAVLFMMTQGRFPFEQNNILELLENIAQAKFTLPDGTEENLKDLINSTLEVSVEKRLSFKQVVEKHTWLTSTKHFNKEFKNSEITISTIPTKFTDENIQYVQEYSKGIESMDGRVQMIRKKDAGNDNNCALM